MKPIRLLVSVALVLVSAARLAGAEESHLQDGRFLTGPVLWRIGTEDGSAAEFTGKTVPTEFTIPGDWSTRTVWPEWKGSADRNSNWTSDISYSLDKVPAGGAVFAFKPYKASPFVPELAIFSNGLPCGIIQIGGATYPGIGAKGPNDRRFAREHQIYIPREFLVEGKNTLTVQRLGHPYQRGFYLWLDFSIDYMRLNALDKIPDEPVHSNFVKIGYSEGQFPVNPKTIATAQAGHEWMGVAYSNNPERGPFFNELVGIQKPADRLAYMQKLKELNMEVIMMGWGCGRTTNAQIVDGKLPEDATTYITNLFRDYGTYMRYYEICNEPCMRIGKTSYDYCVAVANLVNKIKPDTVILNPPSYTFGGGYGDPVNWDNAEGRDRRRALDALCSTLNGHSFAQSYMNANGGGSFIETVDTYGKWTDNVAELPNGFPKPFVTTEMGSATCHWDLNEIPTNRYASIEDRNIRAHIGFADVFLVADLWNNGVMYNYLKGTPDDLSTWQAAPCSDGKDDRGGVDTENRVKVLRRFTLAYATHGRPLPYTYSNPEAVKNELVYFRAVDTSALPPIPGSGATSKKLLLNFVNFNEQKSYTVAVRVTMPKAGSYAGVRYGSETSYTAARTEVTLDAKPELDLSVDLGPGESVQYILEPVGA
ncbi:hypothetical protein SAMN05444156_0922 [Verrucomicrobium sp. GAS474]|uniref:hypothetical protein n=1 Tax=Verrucomicrobium sp. GAS474 TaxID=1882831 RepID=UPI0008797098|nr:hypothetical protein [Verrucomicrobium sp. GAS474]SDT94054.1 hypothetical protein SAMN05444156_0922 [Verrucomicrobium sp. GAS474]